MKGYSAAVETIGVLLVLAIDIFILSVVFLKMVDDMKKGFNSAQNTAVQLSNLITISGSAPYQAEINYNLPEGSTCDAVIKSRYLTITLKNENKDTDTQPFAVNLHDKEYDDVNYFTIDKKMVEGESNYEFSASKK